MDNLLSVQLQRDILRVLMVFQPYYMTASQYFDCFGDCDEFRMLANVEALISQGLINESATHVCDGEKFISLGQLKLTDIAPKEVNTA